MYTAIAFIYLIATFLFAFLPFWFVVKKWKPVTWWKWAGAIVATFFLYCYGVVFWTNEVEIVVEKYLYRGDYITQTMEGVYIIGPLVSLLLSLSPILAVWFIYRKYTWKRFFTALGACFLVFVLSVLYWYWILITGARMLVERFNG